MTKIKTITQLFLSPISYDFIGTREETSISAKSTMDGLGALQIVLIYKFVGVLMLMKRLKVRWL